MLLTHISVCLPCLITPSVQKLQTTAQTPLGKRRIRKHTVRIFLVHMLTVLITEFTFHPHISSPSLGIGCASVMALRVHTGSDRRANRQTNTKETYTNCSLRNYCWLHVHMGWAIPTWCINLSRPRRSFRDTSKTLGESWGGQVSLCALILIDNYK